MEGVPNVIKIEIPDSPVTENTENSNETKCGVIVVAIQKFSFSVWEYKLVCEFCSDYFGDVHSFGNHLETHHYSDVDRRKISEPTQEVKVEITEYLSNSEIDAKELKIEVIEDLNEPTDDTKGSNNPVDDTNELNEPIEDTKDPNNPVDGTIESNQPIEDNEGSNNRLDSTNESNESIEVTEESNEPIEIIEDSNESIDVTGDLIEPIEHIEDSNEPFEDAEYSNEPFEDAEDSNEPLEDAEDSNEPFEDVEDSNNPVDDVQESNEMEDVNDNPVGHTNVNIEPICDSKLTVKPANLQYGYRAEFNSSERFCYICAVGFGSTWAFTRHKHKHYRLWKQCNGDIICDVCRSPFKMMETFKLHVTINHPERIPESMKIDPSYLQCQFCNVEFTNVLHRHRHEGLHSKNVEFNCRFCTEKFHTREQRNIHASIQHGNEEALSCSICFHWFKKNEDPLRHMETHQNILDRPYACDYCPRRFQNNAEYINHVCAHIPGGQTLQRMYMCFECDTSFYGEAAFEKHVEERRTKLCGRGDIELKLSKSRKRKLE